MNNHFIVIMAGGIGSRFWPASTAEKPKQFLDILGVGMSLLQMTFERCLHLVPKENILVLTNKKYVELVQNQLPNLPENNILGEPSMNNTAPTVAYAALHINAINPQATFAVLPSDHVILKEKEYLSYLNQAYKFAAENDALITLGIKPTRPDTGYGYIELSQEFNGDFQKVTSFKEKPNLEIAQEYLKSGNYLWNAGMFVWSVDSILKAFSKYTPKILTVLNQNPDSWGSNNERTYVESVYPNTEKTSVDYAILERADNVYTLPVDIGWSDLGTWNSLYQFLVKESEQVVTIGNNINLMDCENSIVVSNNDKKIVVKGLKDFIVIDEEKAMLIYPKSKEQEIKSVVKNLV